MTRDIFALVNHKNEVLDLVDISNLPETFDKLISVSLDPMVYRMRWINENCAEIWEYWWGTTCYKFYRIPEDKLSEYHHRLFLYRSTYRSINLKNPLVASSSPFNLNRN